MPRSDRRTDVSPGPAAVRLAGLAEACGARGYTVRTVEDLGKLGPVFADLTGPVLVDVRTDPAIEFDLAAG